MNMERPSFIDSEYFYWNNEGVTIRERMKLLPNAPKLIREEYEDYVSTYEEWQRMNEQGLDTPPLVSLDDLEEEGR